MPKKYRSPDGSASRLAYTPSDEVRAEFEGWQRVEDEETPVEEVAEPAPAAKKGAKSPSGPDIVGTETNT